MADNAGETVNTSDNADDKGQNGQRIAEAEVEAVAPWQQVREEESGVPEETGESSDHVENLAVQNVREDQQYGLVDGLQGNHEEVEYTQEGEDVNAEDMDPLAGLGSVDDIAAAAMQAAGLSALFGESGVVEGEAVAEHGTKRSYDEMIEEQNDAAALLFGEIEAGGGEAVAERGRKRSYDEMTKEQKEAAVMEAFSTVAPGPSDPPTTSLEESSLPASTNVASFQNSFAQFQPNPTLASLPIAPLQSTEAVSPVVESAEAKEAVEDTAAASAEGKAIDVTASNAEEQDTNGLVAGEDEDGGELSGLPLIGFQDLQAVAQAAMGLDANGNPLPGNEESHRALAEAVKRLSAAQGITLPDHSDTNRREDDDGTKDDSRGSQDGGPVKRFQCTQCERAFARAYNLNTHLATHDPDPARSKPFPCPYPSCKTDGGRSFSRKHDLQRHVASTHENEPEPTIDVNDERQMGGLASLGLGTPGRKFRCDECGRAFVRRDALKRHQCSKVMETSSEPTRRAEAPDYYTNAAAGLSLYTSNGGPAASRPLSSSSSQLQQGGGPSSSIASGGASTAGSSYDSDPFGPNGITYENLSKEVQDMAMQLVAQAQSYNEQKSKPAQVEQAPDSKVDDVPASAEAQPSVPVAVAQPSVAPPTVTQSNEPIRPAPVSAPLPSTPLPQHPQPAQAPLVSASTLQEPSTSQPARPPQSAHTHTSSVQADTVREKTVVKVEDMSRDEISKVGTAVAPLIVEGRGASPIATSTTKPASPTANSAVKVEEGDEPSATSPAFPPATSSTASTTAPSLVSAQ
jgi:ribosomal protein S26